MRLAAIDGSYGYENLTIRFVLPLITPAILIVTFIRFIDSFRVFDHIFCFLRVVGQVVGRHQLVVYIFINYFFKKVN